MKPLETALVLAFLGAGPGCGGSTSPTPAATTSSVSVSGTAPGIGATAQFAATATLSNGTTQTATAQAAWSSSNTSVASVSSAGLVTGVAAGEADIAATFQNQTGRLHVTIVSAAPLAFTLSGIVNDATSGGILPNITIQVTDSAGTVRSAVTGSTGAFSIGGLSIGPASLTASAVSYQTTTRTVAITADTRVDIALPRVVCTLTLSASNVSFPTGGGTGSVAVTSQSTGCAWQARSNDAFITVTSGSAGTDAGTVSFSVAANTGAARSGSLTIAGTTVTVTQAAAPVMVTAVYDPTFKAPICNDIGLGCDSGTLLQGSGSTESNQPNTVFNSCPDGAGAGHFGLIRFIRVATLDGSAMAPAKTVRIDVSDSASTAGSGRVYLAADAQNPVWTQVGASPSFTGGLAFSVQTTLPVGRVMAIRVTRSFIGSFGAGPCATGPDDDNDDLVFRLQ